MKKIVVINKKLKNFKTNTIDINGDKSISIRFVILASLSKGKCIAQNILKSEDVLSVIKIIRKLGIKIKFKKNYCEVYGKGLGGYKFKKNLILNAGNSGTTARLICSALINSKHNIKITGDESLKKRDMYRIINPLTKFGLNFKSNNGKLPLTIKGSSFLQPIKYFEKLGSAQCKSAVMIASLFVPGKTQIKSLPSRNHTELMFQNVLKLPIKIKRGKNYDFIEIDGKKEFDAFNYKIPGDISSASFFIVLTLLSKNLKLKIRNINVNPSRIGVIKILNLMGAKIKLINKKTYNGENIADLKIISAKNLKSINLNPKLNSSAIDEFLLIFLVAGLSKGVSTFKNLGELNKKESKRLDWGFKILRMIGIKVSKEKNNGIKIWGNPQLELNKTYKIENYLKDHRIFMLSVVAALTLGGKWIIHDSDSFKTSFPSFLKNIKKLGGKIN